MNEEQEEESNRARNKQYLPNRQKSGRSDAGSGSGAPAGRNISGGGKEDEDMEMRVTDTQVCFSATNAENFKDLLQKAKEEARQLNDTIAELSRFEFTFDMGVQ